MMRIYARALADFALNVALAAALTAAVALARKPLTEDEQLWDAQLREVES